MEISISKLMELFVDTLQKCGMHLLEMNDEHIGYNIFEEFDIGASSFLHKNTLAKLREAGLITEEIEQKCDELRKKYMRLQNTELWNVSSVKHSKAWHEVLKLSDEIKSLL